MQIRAEALVALLFAVAVTLAATAGVAAMTALDPAPDPDTLRDGWMAGASTAPAREATPAETPMPAPERPSSPPPSNEVAGIASTYPGTAGWMGEATVALPGALGGRYDGEVNGHVTVCADRCARLPVVDWCQCYWGTDDQRIVDLSHPAWRLISDAPLAEGLVEVRVILER